MFRSIMLRLVLPIAIASCVVAYVGLPYIERLLAEWFRSDVELRAQLVMHSMEEPITDLVENGNAARLQSYLAKITADQRLLAILVCRTDGATIYKTEHTPATISCASESDAKPATGRVVQLPSGSVQVSRFDFNSAQPKPFRVLMLHDLSFADRRQRTARDFVLVLVAISVLLLALLFVLVAWLQLRRWVKALIGDIRGKRFLDDAESPRSSLPILSQVRQVLAEVEETQRLEIDFHENWTPQALRQVVRDYLHSSQVIIVSNREPYIHNTFSLTSKTMKRKVLWGTCDLSGRLDLKDADAVLPGPLEAERAAPSKNPVVVFSGDWPRGQSSVHLLFTLAGAQNLDALAADAGSTFEQSVRFYRTLAQRVQVRTPDPYFDLAVESMVIANDGMWQPPSFLHGALSWMEHYLGWRGWYGSEALGWHDRVLNSILAFAALQIQSGDSRGAIPEMLEEPNAVFYNMNEVYLDDIYYHYLWTGDRRLLASLFPVIQGVLSWEKRRLDPDDNALYESCLNTWISDSHWYSGGDCSQASAYMFRGYQLASEAAEAAGEDPQPYRQEAERIRAAMNDRLWIASQGHYAEFIDRLGLKRVHPEPELPTLYHPIDFGVTDPFQAYQMLRFTETSLRNESGIPRGGRLVWSSELGSQLQSPLHSQHL